MDITVISYYLIALIISITSIGFQSLVKTERKHHNRLFNMLLLIVCISSLAVIAQGSLLSLMPESATRAYMRIPRYVYFLVHTGLAPVFYVYIFMLSGEDERIKKIALAAFEFFIHEPVTMLMD